MRIPLIRAVLYDHDGTLIDSIPVVVKATNKVLLDRGLPPQSAANIIAGMVLPTGHRMAYMVGDPHRDHELLAQAYYDAARNLVRHVVPYLGIAEMLAGVHATNRRQGVVSNNEGAFVEAALAQHDMLRFMTVCFGADHVAQPKPAPHGLQHAAKKLDLEPSDCLYVGDSIVDIQAAHAAGMPCVAVSWGTHTPSEFPLGTRVIDEPCELLRILGEWQTPRE